MNTPVNQCLRRAYLAIALAVMSLPAPAHEGMDHSGMAHAARADPHAQHQTLPAGYSRALRHYTVPDIDMVSANGQRVALREKLAGEGPVMLNFIFTSCTAICPLMSSTFAQVQKLLGDKHGKVRMISISIDPEQDTPAQLRQYAARYGAGPQWHFLTGSLADSVAVQRAFDTYRGGKMNPVPLTLMRAGPNEPWLRLEGLASADEIMRDYRRLGTRNAAPKQGSSLPMIRALVAMYLLSGRGNAP